MMENVWGRPVTALWGENWCDTLPGCSASGDGVNQLLCGVWVLSEPSSGCRQVGLASDEISAMGVYPRNGSVSRGSIPK